MAVMFNDESNLVKFTAAQVAYDNRAEPEATGNSGTCMVHLGQLDVLASYSFDFDGLCDTDVNVCAITINGHEVESEWFDDGTLKSWAALIAADRRQDKRITREAAAYAAWEAKQ